MAVLSNDIITSADVIILLEGDGYNRIAKAVELYNNRLAPIIFFSGGSVNYEYGSYPAQDMIPKLIANGIPENSIIVEDESLHTQAQAVNFLKIARNKEWRKAIIVASPDHQYRAYLTFLRQILDTLPNFILMNAPAQYLPWFEKTEWGAPIYRLELELDKIDKYTKLGHLASFEEALKYQEWKEQQLKKQN